MTTTTAKLAERQQTEDMIGEEASLLAERLMVLLERIDAFHAAGGHIDDVNRPRRIDSER